MGFNPMKDIVRKSSELRKTFSYDKGAVHLDFTLRIDTKQELKDFKEILLRAVEEVEEEIKK